MSHFVVLALLQNQWMPHPERWEQQMASPRRRRYIKALLFYRCLTGRRLVAAGFEPDAIIWEEVHPKIGSKPSDCFGVDQAHVERVLADVKPDLVLRFGKVAQQAVVPCPCLDGPHPAARHSSVTKDLKQMFDWYSQIRRGRTAPDDDDLPTCCRPTIA